MLAEDNGYDCIIDKNHSEVNDFFIEFLAKKLTGKSYTDIGANCGYLLDIAPNGRGCDLSTQMVELAREKGHDVVHADANYLPYEDNSSDVCVLSCILEQVSDPFKVIDEALRVCREKVIGLSPFPKMSDWGTIGISPWVKSVIEPEDLKTVYKARVVPCNETHYYFEINKI